MFDLGGLLGGGKQLVGLDIGSSSLKLAEVQTTSKGRVLVHFSQLPLAHGVIVEGVVAEPGILAATIKELYKKSRCKRRKVVTSLSGHSVIVKKVTLPQMEESELRELIRDEAGKYLPFDDMSKVDYDSQILGENPYNPTQMEVLLVAVKKEITEGYTEAIRAAGLIPMIMDVDSFALETMYEENYDFQPEDVAVLVNIGASVTNLNAVRGGMSIFTRDFPLAGNAVTEALAQNMGVSRDEAEKAKIEGVGDDASARQSFREGLLVYADPICLEIERSIDYLRSNLGVDHVKEVLLSGGGALLPGLAADLGGRLGIETRMADPFRKIRCEKGVLGPASAEEVGPVAAVSVGLALRRLGDK